MILFTVFQYTKGLNDQVRNTTTRIFTAMIVISDRTGNIQLPVEPGLLEWLQQHYPHSQYHLTKL